MNRISSLLLLVLLASAGCGPIYCRLTKEDGRIIYTRLGPNATDEGIETGEMPCINAVTGQPEVLPYWHMKWEWMSKKDYDIAVENARAGRGH